MVLRVLRKFRPDIDVLRAIAVGAVVLFHLKLQGFNGGFAGVDIFFVISGYLITGNILRDIELGQFSFAAFYARRARRILPALIATVMLTFGAGLLWLPPEALRQLAKEATHGLLSISNIQYWREANQYFAPSSEQLGLLHLWSLSLEEQFYLVSPLFLVVLSRLRFAISGIAVAGLASLIAAIIWLPGAPEAVFFLTPFRVFEFVIGALAIPLEQRIATNPQARTAAVSAGYLVLAGSIVALGDFQNDAGLAALPACLATAAIIAANRPVKWITNGVVLGIGKMSYALYLVHWPVIFFARFIFGPGAETVVGLASQLVLMGVLTILLHLIVEQPLRQLKTTRWRQGIAFATAVICCAVLTHLTFKADGLRSRLPAAQFARLDLQRFGMETCTRTSEKSCAFGDVTGTRSLALLGDSYVHQYVAALDDALKAQGVRGDTSTVGGCLMLIGATSIAPRATECANLRDSEIARIKASSADFVVIGEAWHIYLDRADAAERESQQRMVRDALTATIRELDRPGRRFLIVGAQVRPTNCAFDSVRMQPGPLWHAPPQPCDPFPGAVAREAAATTDAMLSEALQPFPNAQLLRPSEVYCDPSCPVVANGVWLFLDPGHFTVAGAERMGQQASSIVTEFLSQPE